MSSVTVQVEKAQAIKGRIGNVIKTSEGIQSAAQEQKANAVELSQVVQSIAKRAETFFLYNAELIRACT